MVNQTEGPRRGFSVCYIDSATRRRAQEDEDPRWPQIFPAYEPGERIDNSLQVAHPEGGAARM